MTQKETLKNYLIAAGEPVSRKAIALDTGIAIGSLARLISELRDEGVIEMIPLEGTTTIQIVWSSKAPPTTETTPTTNTCCGQCSEGECGLDEMQRITESEYHEEQGSYHGMIEPHPDDAPEIAPPINTAYISALLDAKREAYGALDLYTDQRQPDPTEARLKAIINSLNTLIKEVKSYAP